MSVLSSVHGVGTSTDTPGTAAYLGQAGVAACFPGILQWKQQHVVSSQSTKYNARQFQMK